MVFALAAFSERRLSNSELERSRVEFGLVEVELELVEVELELVEVDKVAVSRSARPKKYVFSFSVCNSVLVRLST